MQALSEAQFRAATDGGVPDPEQVDAELWSLAVPMPGGHLAYTLSVVHVGADGHGAGGAVTVVDPGWETAEGRAALSSLLASLGRGIEDIAWIVATHAHPDHLGAAAALGRASGARLLLHEREQAGIDRERALLAAGGSVYDPSGWGIPDAEAERITAQAAGSRGRPGPEDRADHLLRDGERLPIPGVDWEVLWTPGHTAGHICLVDRARRIILTGDHVLPHVFPGVGLGPGGPGERPVADYLDSLDRLASFDGFAVLPGHGYRFSGLGERRAEMTAHILTRAGEVAEVIARDPEATVWEVASRLSWSAGWEGLKQSPMLASALLQTGMHLDFVRSGGAGPGDLAARER